MKHWTNTIAGSVLLLFSIALYFLIPYQIGMIETEKAHMAPSFYPKLILVSLAFIALIYLIVSIVEESRKNSAAREKKMAGEDAGILAGDLARALITIAITLIYVYVFEILGFFVATPLLLGAMMFHMGNRRLPTFCLVMIFTPLIMYILFDRVMSILLPKGIFF